MSETKTRQIMLNVACNDVDLISSLTELCRAALIITITIFCVIGMDLWRQRAHIRMIRVSCFSFLASSKLTAHKMSEGTLG